MKILFIGKSDNPESEEAANILRNKFPESTILFGKRGESFPEEAKKWGGDYVFSFLSQWIIPEEVLLNANKGALNWHPGPPEYPGIGCTNFAIYNEEKEFGITCHHMNPKVDTGEIIEVRKFSVNDDDSVFSITQKCYIEIIKSFKSILDLIAKGADLPESNESWKRKPYLRKELDALCRITSDMDKTEINKRIKATTYDKPWAFVEIKGMKFYWKDENQ